MAAARPEQPELCVADVAAWRAWLDEHEGTSDGVWLRLSRKATAADGRGPTSLVYPEALEEALCSGWIDGQSRRGDERTYLQRFTPRRARSLWSVRNTASVARRAEEGRLRPRGLAEVERAQADGRWDRAYAGPATMEVPPDLRAALEAVPALARDQGPGGRRRAPVRAVSSTRAPRPTPGWSVWGGSPVRQPYPLRGKEGSRPRATRNECSPRPSTPRMPRRAAPLGTSQRSRHRPGRRW